VSIDRLQDRDLLSGALIAFDLDGTLVDTAPDLIGALNDVLAERRLPAVPVEAARALVGHGAKALIERGFSVAGEPLPTEETPALVARFIDIYRTRIAAESRPFPGVERALDDLAAAGAALAVCTNKRTDLSTELLTALNLADRFAVIVGADLAPAPKPDGRHLIFTAERAGVPIGRTLMVGDSANDVNAAKAAGAPVVAVSFGYTDIPAADLGADQLMHHFDELIGHARRLLP
jgi:phosphoglycolate phosphatase